MLYQGSRGNAVAMLQSILNQVVKVLPLLKVDGVYGPLTTARVTKFQRSVSGLKVDGVYGPKTEAELSKAFARIKPAAGVKPQPIVGQAQSSQTTPQVKTPAEMTNAEREAFIRTHSKSFADLSKMLGSSGLSNLVFWASRVTDAVKFINTIGLLDKLAGAMYAGTASTAFAANTAGAGAITSTGAAALGGMIAGSAVMLGNLLFLVGCALTIGRIYGDAQKAYALRSVAYTITAWAFNKPQVNGSSTISSHSNDQAAYQNAWRTAQNQTLQHLRGKSIAGLKEVEFKEAVQILYKGDTAAFCRDLMRSMASQVPGKANQTAWLSHLSGSGFAVLYPR